jgi:hypothetical protein
MNVEVDIYGVTIYVKVKLIPLAAFVDPTESMSIASEDPCSIVVVLGAPPVAPVAPGCIPGLLDCVDHNDVPFLCTSR